MKRRDWLFGGVAAGAAVAGAAWWQRREDTTVVTSVPPASPAETAVWSLTFERPEGGTLDLATLRGQPLLLNFWATWCPPCITELPLLDRFHHTHRASGWTVVGLAVDGPTPVRQFLAARPLAFPVGLAGLEGVDLTRSLGNANGALPFTVVFGRDGAVRDRKLGALSESDLDRYAKTG